MKISIITASYNYAQYIEEAIKSVIAQSYQDWELIVVDDGSRDNSVEIIESYCAKDSRIKLFKHDQNKGLEETLLLGLLSSTGDWIAFLESDDVLAPDNLLKKVEIIEDAKTQRGKEAKLIFNKVEFLCEEERPQQKIYEKIQSELSKRKFPANMFYEFGVDNKILTFSSVMVQKAAILEVDFGTPYDCALDRWLWVQLAQKTNFYYIDETLTHWRLHSGSYIQTKKPIFYFPQLRAYLHVLKKDKTPLKLGVFILLLGFRLIFKKTFRLG